MAHSEATPYHVIAELPRPSLEALFASDCRIGLFHWMVLTLLERGQPMPLERIAQRLKELGVRSRTGDLQHSLQKAWHGLAPVYKTPEGKLGLDAHHWKLRAIAHDAKVGKRRPAPAPLIALPERKPDTQPLDLRELETLLAGGVTSSVSNLRLCAAVLEVTGEAMHREELVAWVLGRGGRLRLTERGCKGWRSPMVRVDEDGVVALGDDPRELAKMRRAIREVVQPRLRRQAEREAIAERIRVAQAQREEQLAEQAREAASLRRALLHALPSMEEPAVVVLLDVERRELELWSHDALETFPERLERYDVLLGDGVRQLLASLGCSPGRLRVLELSPPQKTRTLNRAGRKLDITTSMLLRASTGLSLGDPAKIARYVQQNATTRLEARAAADAKALLAYYLYGRLHGYVRLRWGFLDERLPVEWGLPGEPTLYALLQQAAATGRDLEVVVGSAPGWADPWARAKAARLIAGAGGVWVDELGAVPLEQVQALRVVGEAR